MYFSQGVFALLLINADVKVAAGTAMALDYPEGPKMVSLIVPDSMTEQGDY